MTTDSEISVRVVANSEGVPAGMAQAVQAIKHSTDEITESLKHMSEKADESNEVLKKILKGEYFMIFAETAKEAFETVERGFEATIGKAEEWGLSNAKFAATMGTTEEQAAGMSAALRGVGASASEFEGIVTRLTMRVNRNEKAFQEMGIQTRDASGALMTGKDLFDSAVKTMESLKSGYDQNAFAAEVFGKRAIDVYNIIRVGDEQVQHQIEIFNEMGVQMTGAGSDSAKLEDALNDLHTMVDALGIKIGQELMPVAQNALQWMGTEGVGFARDLALGVADLGKSIAAFVASALQSLSHLKEAWDGLSNLTKRFDRINQEMDAADAAAMDGRVSRVDALKNAWGHFTTALNVSVHSGPLEDANSGLDQQRDAADDASRAMGHLSEAWDKLLDGFSRAGQPVQTIAESLGALKGTLAGADAALDPLMQLISKQNPFTPPSGAGKVHLPQKGPKDHSAEDEIKDDAKIAEAKVHLEEQTNQHLLAMSQETADQFVRIQRDLEDRKFTIQRDALDAEAALPGKTQEQKNRLRDEELVLEITHKAALEKIDQDAEKRKVDLARQAVEDLNKLDDDRLKDGLQVADEDFKEGRISAEQKYAIEKKLTDEIRGEQIKRLDDELATLKVGTAEYEKVKRQRDQLADKQGREDKGLDKTKWKDTFDTVRGYSRGFFDSFNQGINGMLLEGKNFGDTMKDISKSMASALIGDIEETGEKLIEQAITSALVQKTETADAAISQVGSNAAVAASGAAASQAGIPIIGPILAAAAATAMVGLVLGFESLAHASGGMSLDRDQLVFAHKGEQILPAPISRGLTNMIQNGSGSGDTNIHYNPQITGASGKDLAQLLREQPRVLAAVIKQLQRDGSL